jgi:hypothetical protein
MDEVSRQGTAQRLNSVDDNSLRQTITPNHRIVQHETG